MKYRKGVFGVGDSLQRMQLSVSRRTDDGQVQTRFGHEPVKKPKRTKSSHNPGHYRK